ncbi:uncharacterized protein I303_107409 [Kwoniella dejecticola CBS 10117]|uniref:Zn(2)-C6 fungal-type domain-containing protein n=1 Tax=Kwoniella dejecticola CBS 10117 TaxID=1296121 RepID=A0A1A5ZZL3_9TREE|nr:uncharacterized protein I303_06813 [Kwoniella dejecticola CBS 10117]OBR83251.1 hypothetical protein I303_06813 [Kwoniella dejecticola CBS 10117]
MNPTPAKRARRTSSPSSPTESTSSLAQHQRARPPTASPSHPILPAPIPSNPPGSSGSAAGPFPPFAPGPSGWQSNWRSDHRRSFDAGSPSSITSPKLPGEDIHHDEASGGVIFTRDVNSRAPRSMMACTRCRRQKMKCDGPSQVPCRGCRQSGQPCIFEPRSRPKSISVIPSRPPPFHMTGTGRPGSPGLGFYPAGPQPAPPITSRLPPPGAETYAFRQAREPMPPPPATSLAALTSPYAQARHSPPPSSSASIAHPPPPLAAQPPQSQPPAQAIYHPPISVVHPPPFSTSGMVSQPPPPQTSSTDSRLRHVESSLRHLHSVPSAIASLQQSIISIQRHLMPKRSVPVHEGTWENYRNRAWPLTPWLVGLRETEGLPGMVVDILGRRSVIERDEFRKRECDALLVDVNSEVGRLTSERGDWSREEIRSLGVLATWINEPVYAAVAIAQARSAGLDKLNAPRKNHDDWREWIYLVIMDHLCHIPDFQPPVTRDPLAMAWREKLSLSPASDLAVRDRDSKLLAWLEYSEILAELQQLQTISRNAPLPPPTDSTTEDSILEDRRARAMDPWRKFQARIEGWSRTWQVMNDPILGLHHNYVTLFASSPAFLADERIWQELADSKEGYTILEIGREAATKVIQAICSVEIGRTLPYSFALFRPLLGLAIIHLISLTLTPLPSTSSPLIGPSHLLSLLRQAYDAILTHQPIDRIPIQAAGAPCLLAEIVESGRVELAKRSFGSELTRDLWRRVVG